MKKIYFLGIGIIYSFFTCCHEDPTQEPANFYKIINDNSQKIVQKTQNAQINEYLFSLPIDEQRTAFKSFSPAKRRECLQQLDFKNFEKFLKAYSEHEWQELRNALTEHEKTYWPTTVKEQLIELHKIRNLAENGATTLALGSVVTGVMVNPIITYAYCGYVLVCIVKDGTSPVRELIKEEAVKFYMEKKYEL